jgi:nicotinamide-nucleotide amidase
MAPRKKVEMLAIGDELLNGLRTNTHLTFVGDKLLHLGLPLVRSSEVRDEPAEMRAAFAEALSRADCVLCTGGLGPTSDDMTVATWAALLDRPLLHDATVEAHIRDWFAKRGREPTENNFRQCKVIQGAQVLHNPNGTAPGQWLELDGKVVILLPGPPGELVPLFEKQVIPRMIDLDWIDSTLNIVHLRTIGLGESMVAKILGPILEPHAASIRVAYCAHLSYVDVRLSATADILDEDELDRIGEECREALGQGFLCYGERDIACLLLEHLRDLDQSLAVAESCTGGLLASKFTDVPGASKTFKGGIICYRNEIKEQLLNIPSSLLTQHGAVSAECSVAMATGVAELMEADYALSITGYAGPDGGSEPAGTVYVGFCSPSGVWSRKIVLPGNRSAVKERATTMALDFMRAKIARCGMQELLMHLRC